MQPTALNTGLRRSFWVSLGSSVSQISPTTYMLRLDVIALKKKWTAVEQATKCSVQLTLHWKKDKNKGSPSHTALEANGSHYSASCHPAAHARPGAGSMMCWQPECQEEKKPTLPRSRPTWVTWAFCCPGPQLQTRLTFQPVSSMQQQWQQRSTQHPGLHLCANRASFKLLNRRLICYWEVKAIEASPIQSSGFCITLAPGIFLAKLPTILMAPVAY